MVFYFPDHLALSSQRDKAKVLVHEIPDLGYWDITSVEDDIITGIL
jgi:hypothetical protein